MITWDKRNGFVYEDEQTSKRYSLYEAKCYQGEATSDIVIMWDEERNCFANYVYGATNLFENIAELDETVRYYVEKYETKDDGIAVNYRFNKAGVKAFVDGASADFFADMDDGGEHLDQFDIVVSCGKHQIRIPLGAEEWNELEAMLNFCLEVNQ